MTNRLHIHDTLQFDHDGIRKTRKEKYQLKEGIIRTGTAPRSFYMERAARLYNEEGVDRIILLSPKNYEKDLERLAENILRKSREEWKRFPNDFLIREDKHVFLDSIEILHGEEKGEEIFYDEEKGEEKVRIVQINLVSNLYSVVEYYLSEIHEHPEELPEKLVRILAGLYPRKWKEKIPKDALNYDSKEVLRLLISMTSDKVLIDYFGFFSESLVEKDWNIEEMVKRIERLLKISVNYHAGIEDLHLILRIIHKSLPLNSISEIVELKDDIDIYLQTTPYPERYTDMLFRKYQNLFVFLDEFQKTSDFQYKLYFLEESRKIIRESEALVEESFVQPFKTLYLNILKKWMDITIKEGASLLGKASLEVKLQTRKAVWKEKLPVSLNVKNIGIGPAENIEVTLHSSTEYRILEKSLQTISVLKRNRDMDIEFQIRPLTKDNINLSFSISHEGGDDIVISGTLFFVQQEEFKSILNPYNFTKPAEESMFFGRDDLFLWIEDNMKGPTIYQNVMIEGQRRTGKTSFLKQLQKHLNSDHYCVFIDVELYPGLTDVEFLFEICQELHRSISNIPSPNPQEFVKKSYMAFGNYTRSLLSDSPNMKKIILIFDEFDKIESKIRDNLFKPRFLLFLRSFFQHNSRVNAIISGNFDFNKLNSTEWQEFFALFNPKKIGVLDESSATYLVTEPAKDYLQYDQYAIKKILDSSGRNPFFIQLLCHTLINYLNEKKKQNFVEVGDIQTIVLKEAREKAEPTLRLIWHEFDHIERRILFALSRLRIKNGQPVEFTELHMYLKQNNIKMRRGTLFRFVDALIEKDTVVKSGGYPPFYDFSNVLMRDWIAEHGRF